MGGYQSLETGKIGLVMRLQMRHSIPGRSGSGRDNDWIRAYTSSIAVIVVILAILLSTMR